MSTVKFEATPLSAHMQASSDGPRKKRKRAPAQGAADDCFTCLNRNIKCDRRRPYCSQCLDVGQDCAGYKTQLTWGVGVASRGKLRGLSLPVAGTAKTTTDSAISPAKSKKRVVSGGNGQNASMSSSRPGPSTTKPTTTPIDGNNLKTSISQAPVPSDASRLSPYAQRPLASREVPFQNMPHGGQIGTGPASLSIYNSTHSVSRSSAAFPLNTGFSPSYDGHKHAQLSPYPTPSPTTQYFPVYSSRHQMPLTPTTHSYQISPEPSVLGHSGYHQPTQLPYANQHEYASQTTYAPRSSMVDSIFPGNVTNVIEDDVEEINRGISNEGVFPDTSSTTSSSSLTVDSGFTFPLSGISVVGKTPRMQYLIQYYAEVISPVIVAFDSPSNPLRNQILGLASRSESLQHAISALSASNIRQRHESGALSTGKTPGARRSSFMHLSLTTDAWDDSQSLTSQDRKREESLHKYAAVRMLNQQLANPHVRKDDSVLATLLMLCLFHICDSGIARFQTQFAGVKKLLNLRANNSSQSNGDTKWMTRIFTLFDAVAATVNDREGQIDSQYVDISAHADGEWPYETLCGVDSRLFKPISRLGRLNILSQGISAESNPTLVSRPLPAMPFLTGHQHNESVSFDGNGWMRLASDEDFFNAKTASPGIQEQFWREWREVRHDLQTWSFDSTRFDGSDPSQPYLTEEQRADMCNISESFRYSSLLYTERLAGPKLPSADTKIQGWVQRSLHHIKQVRADVYLLWPLFITGAECGEEQERDVIRQRCLDIQKDSGFMNNSSCLTLLEKVWQGDKTTEKSPGGAPQVSSTFRFRDVMLAEGNEGEWIVV